VSTRPGAVGRATDVGLSVRGCSVRIERWTSATTGSGAFSRLTVTARGATMVLAMLMSRCSVPARARCGEASACRLGA
jgi:hypothetical protein